MARHIAWAAVVVALVLLAGEARAHVVYGPPTLFAAGSRSRRGRRRAHRPIADGSSPPHAPRARRPDRDGDGARDAEGRRRAGCLTFVPQGHGVAEYADGEEVVLFLQRIARSASSPRTAGRRSRGVGLASGERRRLVLGVGDDAFLAALRAYAAIEALPSAAARLAGLRRVTFELLASHEPRLAASAVRDLALAGDAPLVARRRRPGARPRCSTTTAVAIGARIALLAELERRRLVVVRRALGAPDRRQHAARDRLAA